MWRKVARVLGIGLYAAMALTVPGLLVTWVAHGRPTAHMVLWALLSTASFCFGSALSLALGGALRFARWRGKRLGMTPAESTARGAGIGLICGAGFMSIAWQDPGPVMVVVGAATGSVGGLLWTFLGIWTTPAEDAFLRAMDCREANDTSGATKYLQEYLTIARRSRGHDRKLRIAEQLLRELEGQPAEDGWGTEPEAADPPQGTGTEPEAAAAPAGRGTEPESVAQGPGAG